MRPQKWFIWLGPVLFVSVMGFICLIAWRPITLFASDPEALRLWMDEHIWGGRFLFCLLLIVQVFAAVIPGEPLELAAGYVFGTVEGTILCIVGEAVGGILVLLFVRRFGVKVVETLFPPQKIKHLSFLQNPKKRNIILFLLFLLPGTPKDLLCYIGGLTGVSLPTWVVIQTVGRLPSVLTSTLGGNAFGTQQYWTGMLVLGITALISVMGICIYKNWGHRPGAVNPPNDSHKNRH